MSAPFRITIRHLGVRFHSTQVVDKPLAKAVVGTVGESSRSNTRASRLARKANWQRSSKAPVQADSLQVLAKGGDGGDGCVAFSKELTTPNGPPSGGGGGAGGSILIQAKSSVASLAKLPLRVFSYRGTPGSGDWQPGKNAQDKTLLVPVGTVVRVVPIPAEDSIDESAAHRTRYERRLMEKYQSAYIRSRRMRRASAVRLSKSKKDEEGYNPYELRQQRDAFWRHYLGTIGSKAGQEKSRGRGKSRAERKAESERDKTIDLEADKDGAEVEEAGEDFDADRYYSFVEPKSAEKEVENSDVLEAESDIRELGSAFEDSERRVAFALLSEQQRRGEQVGKPESGELEEDTGWTIDLDSDMDVPITIVRGGAGGYGNAFFATNDNRTPTLATRGAPGQEAIVHLEWKFKGDVGLIGLPNAGKSTFLKAVCATGDDVRVAGYAFTTLNPNVGVVRLGERGLLGVPNTGPIEDSRARPLVAQYTNNDESTTMSEAAAKASVEFGNEESARFILQDLPGLVRGASYNRGLGHDFLKHIERCLALYYVLDVSEAAKTPWLDLRLVHHELEAYRAGLSDKVQGIIANKCDAIHIVEQEQQQQQEEQGATPSDPAKGEADETVVDGRQKLRMLAEEGKALHGRTIPVWNVSAKYRDGVERTARAMANVVTREKRARNSKEQQRFDTEYPL